MEVTKIKSSNWINIKYLTNQYSEGDLALVKNISHLVIEDKIHGRYFVVNFNNQIIYLDQFDENAVVNLDNQKEIMLNFSKLKRATINKRCKIDSDFFN